MNGRRTSTRAATIVAVIAVSVVALLGGAAPVSAEPWPATCPTREPVYTEQRPRIQQLSMEIQGRQYRYSVLLPSDYAGSNRRYPVLYWLHGGPGNHVSAFTSPETPRFFEQLTAGEPVILVFPEGGYIPFYQDWEGYPQHQYETFHMRLIEHIDATYRTHARRSQRAVAGLSWGGRGALSYPALHPELFSSAWTVSGLLDALSMRTPVYTTYLSTAGPAILALCMGAPLPPWGHPVTNPAGWDEHNPSALVDKLHGTKIYVETGDGVPCDEKDAVNLVSDPSRANTRTVEALQVETNRTFHREAQRVGLAHEYVEHCGIHDWRNWERQVKGWFPRLMRSFHDAAPPERKRDAPNRPAAPKREPERRAMTLSVRPTRVRAGQVTTFRVRVTSGRKPVPGVRVRLRGIARRTNQTGQATIQLRLSRSGRYTLTAARAGFATAKTAVRAV